MSDVASTRDSRAHLALRRIAEALVRPVEELFAEAPPDDVNDLLTLVRLWLAIGGGPGRSRVLSLARQEAARFGHTGAE